MGMFGIDLTEFTGYCYDIYEVTGVFGYDDAGCPYGILHYYDGFALGIQVNYFDGTYDEIYNNCTEFYSVNSYFYLCPQGMLCAGFDIRPAPHLYFVSQQAICDWQTLIDGTWTEALKYEQFLNLTYPSYGFSRTSWFSAKNLYEDSYDTSYWLEENNDDGNMSFWNFKAVHEDRMDVGDMLTIVVASEGDADAEMLEQEIELASGVSLAASAAAVLASAILL